MRLKINLKENSYPVYIEQGIIENIANYVDLNRKVMVITDSNIPKELVAKVMSQCRDAYKVTVKPGEQSKSLRTFALCHSELLRNGFDRKDLVIALGGGVVGDLSGFVSSTYKRGIDFVNIPTSTLSQIDSSVGGKTAVNLDGVKNIIGTFYQPKAVFIDVDTLKTLDPRHYNNGLVEAIKAGLIRDKYLFEMFEKDDLNIELIITQAIMVKKEVVEMDEKEYGIRMILNFGHTIGHGLEAYCYNSDLFHGEAVAIGMMKMIGDEQIRNRLEKILDKLNIRSDIEYDKDAVFEYITKDKKVDTGSLNIIKISEIGKAYIDKILVNDIKEYL